MERDPLIETIATIGIETGRLMGVAAMVILWLAFIGAMIGGGA